MDFESSGCEFESHRGHLELNNYPFFFPFPGNPVNHLELDSCISQFILTIFSESGVEILSPHYQVEREGNPDTIVATSKDS